MGRFHAAGTLCVFAREHGMVPKLHGKFLRNIVAKADNVHFGRVTEWFAAHKGQSVGEAIDVELLAMCVMDAGRFDLLLRLVACMANANPRTVLDRPDDMVRLIKGLVSRGRWTCADRLVRHLMPLVAPTIAMFEPFDCGMPLEQALADYTCADPAYRINPVGGLVGAMRPSTSIWNNISTGSIRLKVLDANVPPVKTIMGEKGTRKPSKVAVLGRLAQNYDIGGMSLMGAAWRWWAGPPEPVSANQEEQCIAYLGKCGFI